VRPAGSWPSGDGPRPLHAEPRKRMFGALLNTSVLWPSLQRDFLLSLAVEGFYRPLWSTGILDESSCHEAQKLTARGVQPDRAAARAQHLIDQMTVAFNDALVTNWESLEGTFGLPEPNDEHVVAAALTGGAEVIDTNNLKDFPPQLIPNSITVISPAQFAADTVAVSPDFARRAVVAIASRLPELRWLSTRFSDTSSRGTT
jgi:PIN domain